MRSRIAMIGMLLAAAGCGDGEPAAKPKAPDRDPPSVVVAADRFSRRVHDVELRAHVDVAKTLDEALEWTTPRMGDEFAADRMFAARDVPMIGGAVFARWADAHLKFEELEARARDVDMSYATLDAGTFRGLVMCLRGDLAPRDPRDKRERTLVPRDDGELDDRLVHHAHVAGVVPENARDVRFCGVIVGRRIVASREKPGLLLVGVAKDEPAPVVPPRSLDETLDELLGGEPSGTVEPEPEPRTWSL